jgi:hypothetical protein
VHFAYCSACITSKLYFNDCMARHICAKEMHACSAVRIVRIKCAQPEISRIVRTGRKPRERIGERRGLSFLLVFLSFS